MNKSRPFYLAAALLAALATTLGLSAPAAAQEIAAVDAVTEVEVNRDATDLRDVLVPQPDPDSVDTALVFTNNNRRATLVVCAGYDADGDLVGRARTVVPARGVRLIRASDLSNGVDFVGSARCKSRRRVVSSAFVLGADLSDAPVLARGRAMSFPIIASF